MVKRVLVLTIGYVLINCNIAEAKTVWSYMNKDVFVVMGIVILTMVVAASGLIVEVANQAKVKYYLQIILGISIVGTIIGYFIKAIVGLSTIATGSF